MILRTLVTREILSSLANFWINGHCSVQNIPIFWNFQGFALFGSSAWIRTYKKIGLGKGSFKKKY